MNPRKLVGLFLQQQVLLLVALAAASAAAQEPAGDGPQTTLATESGTRLRVYCVNQVLDGNSRLDPSTSPNHDITLPGFPAGRIEWPNESEPVEGTAAMLQFSGWIKADVAGEYGFQVTAPAACRFAVDEKFWIEQAAGQPGTTQAIPLEAGWHSFELWLMAENESQRECQMQWRIPGEDAVGPISLAALRAPAFHFRPIQSGPKMLAGPGDRPGLGQKVPGVHPGYTVTDIRPRGVAMPVGGLGWLPDGRLVVARFDARTLKAPRPAPQPNGEIWLIENPQDDTAQIRGSRVFTGLREPSGVCVVKDSIYVSQRDNVLRLDELPQKKGWKGTVVASGWRTNDFHQISAGLLHSAGPDEKHPGFLWMARSPGLGLRQNPPDHGSVWKIDLSKPAGQNVLPLTGGHRTPNGIGFGPENELFVIDNQGEWTPANELNHVQPGSFYGFFQPHAPPQAHASPFQPASPESPEARVTQPAVQLPQDEIGNSPTQPLMFPAAHQFGGQLALADMRYGGINRVWLEKVEGVWQGCVLRFTQGLSSGPNRILFGPEGEIYAGGIGGQHASTWYWLNNDHQPTYESLERLTPTGKSTFEIDHVAATAGGLEVFFTEPVPEKWLADPSNYRLAQWRYQATEAYGGPKLEEQKLIASETLVSADGKSVSLTVPELKPGFVIHLRVAPVSVNGTPIWSGDVWYTLNRIPKPLR